MTIEIKRLALPQAEPEAIAIAPEKEMINTVPDTAKLVKTTPSSYENLSRHLQLQISFFTPLPQLLLKSSTFFRIRDKYFTLNLFS